MSSKKIYLIRHGQTDFNRMGIVQGQGVDTSLNDLGRDQARAFYETYRHVKFDRIYISTLKRSFESVTPFIKDGIPYESLSGLNEISWGRKEGHRITPEEDAYYYNLLHEWKSGKTSLKIEGGESPEDVRVRLMPAAEYIFSRTEEKNILICMHGRAMRILLCHLLNRPLSEMDYFEHNNLGLYLLHHEMHELKVELSNDLTHLRVLSEG